MEGDEKGQRASSVLVTLLHEGRSQREGQREGDVNPM